MLREPILYLSLYFKTHRSADYDLLNRAREQGDWEAWLHFFLTGVKETADQAGSAARRILALFEDHLRKVKTLGRASGSALRVYQQLQRNPVVSIGALARQTGLSFPTITSAIGI